VVVVDELGKMELASAAFRDAVTGLLGQDVAVVATVQTARHRFTDALKHRPDVRLVGGPRPLATRCPSSSRPGSPGAPSDRRP
jgi:nucleoside-triphosphatase